jgi:GNAT superfamily N-acetyltransferase
MIASCAAAATAATPDPTARSPRRTDIPQLADLMLAAYRGTTDDSGETADDARAEVSRLMDGAYGAFCPELSEVIERDGHPVSATLVTFFEDMPLIAFSMTAPAWKRRGLARAGLLRTLERLHIAGHASVRLVVTKGNAPAERLYESLGFVPC